MLSRLVKVGSVAVKNSFRMSAVMQQYFAVIKKYSEEHEWVSYDEDSKITSLGITDYAQQQLGDIVHLEFPEIARKFNKGESIGSVESVKVAAEIYTPVSGEVTEINKEVEKNVTLVNQNAEEAWLVKMKVYEAKEMDNLMTKEQYGEFIKKAKH